MKTPKDSPFHLFLERQGVMILDGGLATELEAAGADLSGDLWSARLLAADPARIRSAHLAFLEAGADCIVSASYQATVAGFVQDGCSPEEAEALVLLSVELAVQTRDLFWSGIRGGESRIRPLVAASIGPYGAYLADGSEYTGRYAIGEEELYRFHKSRWDLLAAAGADLLACETIPSLMETGVLCRLMEECPGPGAWFTFSCRDGRHLRDGSELGEAVRMVSGLPGVAGVGVNCVDPAQAPAMIRTVKAHSSLPILVYPNSGERWDAGNRCWAGSRDDFQAEVWVEAGASLIGGCCRVGPEEIRRIRAALLATPLA
ncbi:MAG: homocysteine S-methyltransferase [Acidobacteria bacterium]|uniref:S-methylmethionine:homocysteine methyltransferase n=1 Tax=Candidatus Polarisedimenticola svalbardensis TaxID=2886004 RepID=A0A8J6Y8B8_9BACT|nr:homocysteine S-methyltransferase [Candidatus Polarisedimenticola svalbardensis]